MRFFIWFTFFSFTNLEFNTLLKESELLDLMTYWLKNYIDQNVTQTAKPYIKTTCPWSKFVGAWHYTIHNFIQHYILYVLTTVKIDFAL